MGCLLISMLVQISDYHYYFTICFAQLITLIYFQYLLTINPYVICTCKMKNKIR